MKKSQDLSAIQSWVEQQSGLRADLITRVEWERAIMARMDKLRISSIEGYLSRLARSRAECQELVELLVVAETWFFRDRAAIDGVVRAIRAAEVGQYWGPWKILSMACSTGEEPYSLAMALLDAGIEASQFTVLGVDISRKALEKAEQATYGKNSFRGATAFRRQHFQQVESGYQLADNVRQCVRFRFANIVNPWLFLGGQRFDAVLCRNVLIYLTLEAQQKALAHCVKQVEPAGLFFVGPTEVEIARSAGFVTLGEPNECAFRLPAVEAVTNHRGLADFFCADCSSPQSQGHRVAHQRGTRSVIAGMAASPLDTEQQQAMLSEAQRLANQGNVDAAILATHRYLSLYGGSAEVYFLLGILETSAKRDDEAERFFQKTVYLEPTHYEGLVNLALIAERRGELGEAQRYWKRVRRASEAMKDK